MRALVVKPHRLSSSGTVGEHLSVRGVQLVDHVAREDPRIPPLDGYDMLMCLGAPWSVYGAEVAPWIESLENRFREAAEGGLPTLGVCFGAQAFAQALGGVVTKAERGELGLEPVDVRAPGPIDAGPWVMWHSDTFTVPPGSELLATTESGPQAFVHGRGLFTQFHPEVSPSVFRDWWEIDVTDFDRFGVDRHDLLLRIEKEEEELRERSRVIADWLLDGA